MRRLTSPHAGRAAALMLLTLAPALAGCVGSAPAAEETLSVYVPPLRIGDVIQVHGGSRAVGAHADDPGNYSITLRIDRYGAVTDRFGIEREVVTVREAWQGDGWTDAADCHILRNGSETVRYDHLSGGFEVRPFVLGQIRSPLDSYRFEGGAYYDTGCISTRLGGQILREGDRLPPELTRETGMGPLPPGPSAPGERTTFLGRPALSFSWEWPNGHGDVHRYRLVYADGLPTWVQNDWRAAWSTGAYEGNDTLVGFQPGSGEALLDAGARLPTHNPNAAYAPYDPLRLDDAAFGFQYPFDEALDALLDDPLVGLAEWLDAHPDAYLASAIHWPQRSGAAGPAWMMVFVDGDERAGASTMRPLGAATEGTPLMPAYNGRHREPPLPSGWVPPPHLPTRVATSASLVPLATAAGVDTSQLRYWRYTLTADGAEPLAQLGMFNLSDGESEDRGRIATLDAGRASLSAAYGLSYGTRIAPIAAPPGLEPRAAALPDAAGIEWPEAATAATAGALLLGLVAKLAFALYTRLARDRLLENPVRARLYDRIRIEPGIHREELIDFAGIGNGATRHHLRKLVAHAFVIEIVAGGFARYYAAGEVPREIAREHALLRVGRAREVHELYANDPSVSLRDAARRLGMSAPSVHRIRKRLEAAGLLRATPPSPPR